MMTPERFIALTAAYGADRRHWPEAEREAARLFAETQPQVAAAPLAAADEIDALLHASSAPMVSAALRERVLAATRATKRHGRIWADRLAWAFGAGWTAATCAGVACGILLAGQVTADARADAVLIQASTPALDDTEVLG